MRDETSGFQIWICWPFIDVKLPVSPVAGRQHRISSWGTYQQTISVSVWKHQTFQTVHWLWAKTVTAESSKGGNSQLCQSGIGWRDELLSAELGDIIANNMKYYWASLGQPINRASRPQVIKDELQISQTKIGSESTWAAQRIVSNMKHKTFNFNTGAIGPPPPSPGFPLRTLF